MSAFSIRPAVREQTPLIIGIAGPTKSGKTYSAHRVAQGLVRTAGGPVVMLNAEGNRGHQYADKFKYLACDIQPPYAPARYIEALLEIRKMKPGAIIIDSMSHMHDGPGGMLEQHDTIMDELAGDKKGSARNAYTFVAWNRVKKPENEFIYTMLGTACPLILCFRAKEKIKLERGKDPVDLGWQPIASERVAFETMFTVMLPPHSKGVPDLSLSDMREPFDTMIPAEPLSEALGERLAQWARGASTAPAAPASGPESKPEGDSAALLTPEQVTELENRLQAVGTKPDKLLEKVGAPALRAVRAADYQRCVDWINRVADRKAAG